MPYRPENELKRPDLKGEFLCGHCGKTFCHAASLNRHRLNFHGDDQQCQLCEQKIPYNDTVRRHMSIFHGINRVFTCGCCNWTFPDKKELHAHNNSMQRTGQPGEAKAIAISNRPPGSLSQAELRGEERHFPAASADSPSPRSTASSRPSSSRKQSAPKPSPRVQASAPLAAADSTSLFSKSQQQLGTEPVGLTTMINFLQQIQKANANMNLVTPEVNATNAAEWLTNFLLNNPGFIPLLQQHQSNPFVAAAAVNMAQTLGQLPSAALRQAETHTIPRAQTQQIPVIVEREETVDKRNDMQLELDEDEDIDVEEARPTTSRLPNVFMGASQLRTDPRGISLGGTQNLAMGKNPFGELNVKTETEMIASGPESGIGSGEDVTETDSSPAPSDCSKESTPIDESNETIGGLPKKRKSVDAIASLLFKKKCLMG